ncbi:MFS transporter [Paraclostridium ghonii]|uniref:MFS family permease n=1 Tax=Paraclostridium ghonii TaxID=29358 RepID=A0ABU0N2E4_9FIRM|nr:MFS transporter [Paeniclostridium ghonii]MDQ0557044.1 MFS family permease [Paeniclostridium ghonii]
MKEYLRILKNRNFTLLFLGQWVSTLGSSINYIGITWIVMKLTNRISDLGTVLILMKVPTIIIGPFAGVWADRLNKKHIIIFCDLIRGILSLTLLFFVKVEAIYLVILIQSIFDVFFNPALYGLTPQIVKKEELVSANALIVMAGKISLLIGPCVAGVLIAKFGASSIFLINGISFIISGISEMFINYKHKKINSTEIEKEKFFVSFKEGIEYILRKPLIQFVIIFFAITSIAFGSFNMLYTSYLTEELSFNAQAYGGAMTVFGVGSLVGSFLIGKVSTKLPELKIIVVGMGVYGFSHVILSMCNGRISIFISFACCGLIAAIINIAYGVYLQRYVDVEKLGRVFSIDLAIGNLILILSMGITGFLGDLIPIHIIIKTYGCFLIVLSIIGYLIWKSKISISSIET